MRQKTMRKYLIFAALIFSIAAVSCKKFNNSDQPVSKFTFVSNIDIAESFSLAISAEEKLLAVKLTLRAVRPPWTADTGAQKKKAQPVFSAMKSRTIH